MMDYFDRPIEVGQYVAVSTTSRKTSQLRIGKITKINLDTERISVQYPIVHTKWFFYPEDHALYVPGRYRGYHEEVEEVEELVHSICWTSNEMVIIDPMSLPAEFLIKYFELAKLGK